MSFDHVDLARKPSTSSWFKNQRISSSTPSELSLTGSLIAQNRLFTVAVVGLNDPERQKCGIGAGKSCLCNRFVRPFEDAYRTDHISTVSTVDFNGRVINGDHWLYWGDRSLLVPNFGSSSNNNDPLSPNLHNNDLNLTIRIVEQTEFIDDVTFQSFKSLSPPTQLEPYAKRCAALKLQSVEKLMYICKEQLGFESDHEQKPLPDNKLTIDGFLCTFDVCSCEPSSSSFSRQLNILSEILQNLCKTKKPVVIVTTKNDELDCSMRNNLANQQMARKMLDKFLMSKKEFKHLAQNLVETSSHWNVNIDAAFLLLVHLIDKNLLNQKPKIKTFQEAVQFRHECIKECTENFMNLLGREVRDLKSNWERTKMRLVNDTDYENFVDFMGNDQAVLCFNRHLKELSEHKQKRRLEKQIEKLPKILANLNFNLIDIKGKPWIEIIDVLKRCANFHQLFKEPLSHSPIFDQSEIANVKDSRLPMELLFTNEAEHAFMNLCHKMENDYKHQKLTEEFWNVLSTCGQVTPGKTLDDVKIFLVGKKCYELLDENDVKIIYDQYQRQIIRTARQDFIELMLETITQFVQCISENKQQTKLKTAGFAKFPFGLLNNNNQELQHQNDGLKLPPLLTTKDLELLNEKLSDDFRYRHLNKLRQIRDSMIWQFANFLNTGQQCPAELSCINFTVEDLLENYLSASHGILINFEPETPRFDISSSLLINGCDVNLLIVDLDGMGENFVQETQAFLHEKEFSTNGIVFRFNYSCVTANYLFNSGLFDGSTNTEVTPDGVICVFSCRSSLDKIDQWLKTTQEQRSAHSNVYHQNSSPFYLPPIVLVLACDPANLDDLPYLQQKASKIATPFFPANDFQNTNGNRSRPISMINNKNLSINISFFGITPSNSHVTAERRAKSSNSYFTDGQIERILDTMSREKYDKYKSAVNPNCAKSPKSVDLNLAMFLMCGDDFHLEAILKPFLHCARSTQKDDKPQDSSTKSFIFEFFSPSTSQKLTGQLNIFCYHDSISKLLSIMSSNDDDKKASFAFDGFIFIYSARRKASFMSLHCLTNMLVMQKIEFTSKCIIATVGEVTEFFSNNDLNRLITDGNDLADLYGARFTVISRTSDQQITQYIPFLEDCWFKKYTVDIGKPAVATFSRNNSQVVVQKFPKPMEKNETTFILPTDRR